MSPIVYGCRGESKIVKTSPISTTRPAYITTTRSASSAMSPRSCVMRTIAACVCSCAVLSTSTICAWIVTSSAVVGSSAMRTLGSFAIAIAIIARWRMPPENSCGYWSTRRSANGTPTLSSSSIVRVARSVVLHPGVVSRERLGDLVADREHRVQRRHRVLEDHRHLAAAKLAKLLLRASVSRSWPLYSASPLAIRPGGIGMSPRTESIDTLLPDPDSPTMPSTSPGCRS